MKYVLVPADTAANNIDDTLKRKRIGTYAYKRRVH